MSAYEPTVIGDASLREKRTENMLVGEFTVAGRRVDSGFSRETVPGDAFLTISEHFPEFVSVVTYRFLGQDGDILRFQLEKELERPTSSGKTSEKKLSVVVSFKSDDGVRYIVVPEAFQFTGHHFELVPTPKRGTVTAFFVKPSGTRQ